MLKVLMSKTRKKPALIDRGFRVPVDVIRDLETLAPLFGSNGRAIQIGTELLTGMRRKPKVRESEEPAVWQTYRITPATLDRIQRLLPCYENRGAVLKAVVHILQQQL
jgi:hypothetical protein